MLESQVLFVDLVAGVDGADGVDEVEAGLGDGVGVIASIVVVVISVVGDLLVVILAAASPMVLVTFLLAFAGLLPLVGVSLLPLLRFSASSSRWISSDDLVDSAFEASVLSDLCDVVDLTDASDLLAIVIIGDLVACGRLLTLLDCFGDILEPFAGAFKPDASAALLMVALAAAAVAARVLGETCVDER